MPNLPGAFPGRLCYSSKVPLLYGMHVTRWSIPLFLVVAAALAGQLHGHTSSVQGLSFEVDFGRLMQFCSCNGASMDILCRSAPSAAS